MIACYPPARRNQALTTLLESSPCQRVLPVASNWTHSLGNVAHRCGCYDRGGCYRRSSSSQRPQMCRHNDRRSANAGSSDTCGAVNPERVAPERWARIEGNAPYALRRGAWSPVLSSGPEEVVLVARQRPVIVARSYVVDIVGTQPNRWSVVARESRPPCAVCPNCAERVTLAAMAERMRCVRCQGWFEVERDLAGRKAH